MSRLNSVAIVFIVILQYLNLEISATEPVTFTKQWTTNYHSYKPYVVKVKDQIIVVGLRNNTVNLTSIHGVEINTCKFSVPTSYRVFEHLIGPVVALGNGKIIVRVIMAREDKELLASLMHHDVWNMFIIVDPHDCSKTKTFKIIRSGWFEELQSLLPYHDTFDLFFRNNESTKTPQRFNDQAESIQLDHHYGVENDIWGFYIEAIKPYDASEGYICKAVNRTRNITTLKRLDSKFQLVKEIEVKPWTEGFSVAFDKVSLCTDIAISKTQIQNDELIWRAKLNITCDIFDIKDLNHRFSVSLFELDGDDSEIPINVNVVNLPDGSSVVALYSSFHKYYLQRINVDGSKGEAVLVDIHQGFRDQTIVVSLDGGEICFIYEVTMEKESENTGIVSGKCVDVSK